MCMLFMRNFTTDMMSQSSFLLLDFESNNLFYIFQYIIFFLAVCSQLFHFTERNEEVFNFFWKLYETSLKFL